MILGYTKDFDMVLFYTVCVLVCMSVVFSYSLSVYVVEYLGFGQFHFFIRQLLFGVLGILIMYRLALIEPSLYFDTIGTYLFVFMFVVLAIMPFLPDFLVTQTLGAKRWIRVFGFSVAPVEFFKVGYAYFLARSFNKNLLKTKKHMSITDEMKLYIPYLLLFLLLVPIIALAQKDFGQLVVLLVMTFVMLMFANRSYRIFVFLGVFGIATMLFLILIAPHRINRIYGWWSMVQDSVLSFAPSFVANALRIENYPEPYQVGHSLNAIYHGGYFGTGLSDGILKMGYLSEVHTDFVLAGISEEIGFFGLFVVVGILMFLIQRVFRISRMIGNPKYHLFTLGVGLLIALPLLINFGGITGIIPIKGIAVPFISFGGSSMFCMCIAIGMVLSISRNLKPKDKDEVY